MFNKQTMMFYRYFIVKKYEYSGKTSSEFWVFPKTPAVLACL